MLVLFGYLQYEKAVTNEDQYIQTCGRMAADNQNRIIEKIHQFFLNLSQIPEIQSQTSPVCDNILTSLLFRNEELYSNIRLISPAGEVLCSAQDSREEYLGDHPLFRQSLNSRSFSIGDYSLSQVTQKPIIEAAFPVQDDYGKVVSVIIVTVNAGYFNQVLTESTLPKGTLMTLVDREGTIIAHAPESQGWVGMTYPAFGEIRPLMGRAAERSFDKRDAGGVDWIYDVYPLEEPDDFFLILRRVNSPLFDENRRWLFLGGMCFIVTSIAVFFLGRFLIRLFIVEPIEETIKITDGLAQGGDSGRAESRGESGLMERLRWSIARVAESIRKQAAERQEMERLLREEETRFHAIADSSSSWECWLNQDGTYGYNSPACETITGYKPDEFTCDTDIMQAITHPSDRERVSDHLSDVHANLRSGPSSFEFRIITRGGRVRWLAHTCQPIYNAEREYLGRRVTHQDITSRKQTEESLRSTAQRFLSIVENQGEGIAIIDAQEYFTFSNPAADLIFGLNPGELIGRNLKEFVVPDHLAILSSLIEIIQKGEKNTRELTFLRKDGKKRIILIDASPHFLKDGRYAGAFGVFRDVTEQKLREDRLLYNSTHDTLTGLYNRAYFEEEMVKIQNSNSWPVSIIVIDVDDLKVVNDRMGHSAGDDLLRRTAKILRMALRPWDIVARFGGDEFVIILPNIGYEAGQEILGRIRGIFDQQNKTSGQPPLHISLGLATGEKNEALIDIFNQADTQMYENKKSKSSMNNS